ncbi:hypothetical protein BDP67DRAFT_468452 [Colletotrichum lupini]|nr:hypothetical protein BDP67DRAFT_468452 [Colletotrichum lupini]
MENPRDGRPSTIIEIAPDGDLLLLVGPDETRMRVHCMSLMAVSKPFSVMLGPDWKEGRDRHDQGKASELLLPEDNVAALKIICSVIHHKNSEVPRTLAVGDVLAVAVAADKYDCGNALRFAAESWLRPSGKSASNLMLLTAAAYLLQSAQAFKEITRALILDHDGPYLDLYWKDAESLMTWRIFSLLEEQRGLARLRLAEILTAGVNDATGLCVHKCGWTSKYAYAYMKLLQKEDLWPARLSHTSITKALELAHRMPDPIPEESSTSCVYEYKHTAPAYRRNRSSSLDTFQKGIGLAYGAFAQAA